MKIAIVEDTKQDRKLLSKLLVKISKEKEFLLEVDEYDSGEEFLNQFDNKVNQYDILFLDIYMSEITGIEVAKKIREQGDKSRLVFVTTSNNYATESYAVKASYYLMKPIIIEELQDAFNICAEDLIKDNTFLNIMKEREELHIFHKDIIYIEGQRNNTFIHTKDEKIRIYMSFIKFIPLILVEKRFLQCYRSFIVNMDYICNVLENDFLMNNGDSVPIRKRENKEIKQKYKEYVFANIRKDSII